MKNQQSMIDKKNTYLTAFFAMLAVFSPEFVMAAGVVDAASMGGHAEAQTSGLATVVLSVIGLIGLGAVGVGIIMAIDAAKPNSQTKWTMPIVLVIFGGLAMSLTWVALFATATVTGDSSGAADSMNQLGIG